MIGSWRVFGSLKEPTEVTLTDGDGVEFTVDRHGVIHCKHCGGPCKTIELRRAKDENPRLLVKCMLPSAPGSPCSKVQSVPCKLDWRMVTPLARNDQRYIALDTRFQFKRVHNMGRVRNRVGGKDSILRPKRLGLRWQQTLLSLSVLVDWFRAGLKHGWLITARDAWRGYPKRVLDGLRDKKNRLMEHVERKSQAIRLERQTAGLDSPFRPPEPEEPPP